MEKFGNLAKVTGLPNDEVKIGTQTLGAKNHPNLSCLPPTLSTNGMAENSNRFTLKTSVWLTTSSLAFNIVLGRHKFWFLILWGVNEKKTVPLSAVCEQCRANAVWEEQSKGRLSLQMSGGEPILQVFHYRLETETAHRKEGLLPLRETSQKTPEEGSERPKMGILGGTGAKTRAAR